MSDIRFQSSLGNQLVPEDVVRELINYIEERPEYSYKVIVGTDSQARNAITDFVTAVVVHRVGNGGRYFWRRLAERRPFYQLRDRIFHEATLSIEVAQKILTLARAQSLFEFDFEIHIDVGENGDTRTLISEVVGYIRGNNFEVRTKPQSYAASSVADRHT